MADEALSGGDLRRIDEYIKSADENRDKYENASRIFRKDYFVDYNISIEKMVFHDSGRIKEYKEYEERLEENVDCYFETNVYHPDIEKYDLGLLKIINEVREYHESVPPENYKEKDFLVENTKNIVRFIIKKVADYYGGLITENPNLESECKLFIEQHKKENRTNVIYIGQFKGKGLCRHRSILFKVLCDIVGIKCRILRGWVNYNNKQNNHMWNQVRLDNKEDLDVDCMNFYDFVPEKFLGKYKNLGHSRKVLEKQLLTIDNLKRDYNKIEKKTIGHGGFSIVYRIFYNVVDEISKDGKVSMKKCELAVKEIEIALLNRRRNIKSEKYLRKEVDSMTMLAHPNVVEIIGRFSRMDKEKAYIVMKRYKYNGLKFVDNLERKKIGKGMTGTQKLIEILILLMEVAKGLIYIHSFGVVHFDIKLENILLNWDIEKNHVAEVRIADFGSTKGKGYHKFLTTLPAITKDYTAPEVKKLLTMKDEDYDKDGNLAEKSFTVKSDVFAYGMMLGEFRGFFLGIAELEELEGQLKRDDPIARPGMKKVLSSLESVFRSLKNKFLKKSLSMHDVTRKNHTDLLKNGAKKRVGGSGRLKKNWSSINVRRNKKVPSPPTKKAKEEVEGEEEEEEGIVFGEEEKEGIEFGEEEGEEESRLSNSEETAASEEPIGKMIDTDSNPSSSDEREHVEEEEEQTTHPHDAFLKMKKEGGRQQYHQKNDLRKSIGGGPPVTKDEPHPTEVKVVIRNPQQQSSINTIPEQQQQQQLPIPDVNPSYLQLQHQQQTDPYMDIPNYQQPLQLVQQEQQQPNSYMIPNYPQQQPLQLVQQQQQQQLLPQQYFLPNDPNVQQQQQYFPHNEVSQGSSFNVVYNSGRGYFSVADPTNGLSTSLPIDISSTPLSSSSSSAPLTRSNPGKMSFMKKQKNMKKKLRQFKKKSRSPKGNHGKRRSSPGGWFGKKKGKNFGAKKGSNGE